MRYLEMSLPAAEENLALDEALLLEAEAGRGGEVLRVWEQPRLIVVLGSGCRLAEDVEEAACLADGVPIRRRSTGGGTVLLGRGCLCFSLVLAFARDPLLGDIRLSYRYILSRVGEGLARAIGEGEAIEQAGVSDLAIAGRKFSGNAQQRKRRHLLHHGTILYAFDLARVGSYLRAPPRQPEYRAGREHGEFIRNLGAPVGRVIDALREAWQAGEEAKAWPEAEARRLVGEKYAREEWNRRR
jgi:lipoate-protein ligase A